MGITPGGATPASFMSYGMAKRISKHPEDFGKGALEGVVAPETAAHAAGTSALLPMLTLGIPGSPTAAVLLGGLMIGMLPIGSIMMLGGDLRPGTKMLGLGLEIVAIAGCIAEAARRGITVVLDGFIVGAGALVAQALDPGAVRTCIAAHRSAEPGQRSKRHRFRAA